MGGQGSLDYIDYALRGRGGGVSIKMITYYMIISAQLFFKVVRKKSSYNKLYLTYNDYELFDLCWRGVQIWAKLDYVICSRSLRGGVKIENRENLGQCPNKGVGG